MGAICCFKYPNSAFRAMNRPPRSRLLPWYSKRRGLNEEISIWHIDNREILNAIENLSIAFLCQIEKVLLKCDVQAHRSDMVTFHLHPLIALAPSIMIHRARHCTVGQALQSGLSTVHMNQCFGGRLKMSDESC